MKKKMSEKKNKKKTKKGVVEAGMGYCPFSLCVESRYSRLYRDTGRIAGTHGQAGHGHDMARHGHDTATTRYCQPTRETRPSARRGFCIVTQVLCRNRGIARACLGLAPVVSDYNFCIVTGGRPGCWVYRKTGCDTAHSSATTQLSMRHDTAQEVRDTDGRAATRRGLACDTALLHGTPARACAQPQGRA